MNNLHMQFRLFVAGESANSRQAISNLEAICREHFPNRHAIEVIDVFLHPEQAMDDGVFLTPMLVALSFTPPRSIVGTLSDEEVVLRTLGLDKKGL